MSVWTFVNADSLNDPMRFTFHSPCVGSGSACAEYILAIGAITQETPNDFLEFISKNKYIYNVHFHSLGGDLGAGLRLGNLIREAGFDTVVGGNYEKVEIKSNGKHFYDLVTESICVSACAYAFLGGVTRTINSDGAYGVHQFYGSNGDTGEGSAQVTSVV